MNLTKAVAWICGAGLAAVLAGCGGGNSTDASIGGTVSGLAANTSVVLTDNGGDSLTVTSNGSFVFAHPIASQSSYNVQVATQPAGQTCSVSFGSGVIDYAGDAIKNVTVSCSNDAPIGAVVSGLDSGNSVVLSLTQQNDPTTAVLTVVSANGVTNSFTNTSGATIVLAPGTLYSIAVNKQPANQVCTVNSNGAAASGGVVNSNAITVDFTCQ